MSGFKVVIPARMGSSRFYGKPLVPILGRAMVLRVVDRALQAQADEVIVATDHDEIMTLVEQAGCAAHRTHEQHPSGTDRIAQVAIERGWADSDIVVNVQGDEPAIDPALIEAVAQALHDDADCVMATAAHPMRLLADFLNPNMVKVVLNERQRALYFSRAPIPYPRDWMKLNSEQLDAELPEDVPALRHMGIYAYRVGFLKRYGALPVSALEQIESLEQLRVLAHGESISVHISHSAAAPGVDTPEDVAVVEQYLQSQA